MNAPNKKTKVVVAMSGGIDSSVAAALLKRAGFNVVGVHMKFWSSTGSIKENRCCTLEAEKRARLVAKKLGIPFYVFNFEKEFKKRIVDYFLKEYKAGRTPNPCVVCNREIKFGLLLEKALKLDADYIATGHYCRVKDNKLFKGKDENKDQSYFLWQLKQNQLKHILFPVGGYTKDEVKKLAKKFKLSFAKVKESMEICFIKTTINDFLKKYLKPKPGDIIDNKGNVLGKHQGLYLYTIGQRKGIGFPGGPYYVLGKDLENNALIITKDEKDLYKKELIAEKTNWLNGKEPKLPLKVQLKIRYRSQLVQAVIIGKPNNKKTYKIIFSKPQRAITPGQSAVFYEKGELLGGGTIKS